MESSLRLEGGLYSLMSAHSLNSLSDTFNIGKVEGGLLQCFGEKWFAVFPKRANNHMCGIAVGLEDSSQVLTLLGQSDEVTDLLCYGC